MVEEKKKEIALVFRVKKCANELCGHIIEPHQKMYGNGFCDKFCSNDSKSINAKRASIEKSVKRIVKCKLTGDVLKEQTIYPHVSLPIEINIKL